MYVIYKNSLPMLLRDFNARLELRLCPEETRIGPYIFDKAHPDLDTTDDGMCDNRN